MSVFKLPWGFSCQIYPVLSSAGVRPRMAKGKISHILLWHESKPSPSHNFLSFMLPGSVMLRALPFSEGLPLGRGRHYSDGRGPLSLLDSCNWKLPNPHRKGLLNSMSDDRLYLTLKETSQGSSVIALYQQAVRRTNRLLS